MGRMINMVRLPLFYRSQRCVAAASAQSRRTSQVNSIGPHLLVMPFSRYHDDCTCTAVCRLLEEGGGRSSRRIVERRVRPIDYQAPYSTRHAEPMFDIASWHPSLLLTHFSPTMYSHPSGPIVALCTTLAGTSNLSPTLYVIVRSSCG